MSKVKNVFGAYFKTGEKNAHSSRAIVSRGKQVTDLVMPNIEFEGEEGRGR